MTLYRLTLAALPGDPPPAVRLRRGLKALLRTYRLRCVSIEELPAPVASERRRKSAPAGSEVARLRIVLESEP